jgi:hypothetical protein
MELCHLMKGDVAKNLRIKCGNLDYVLIMKVEVILCVLFCGTGV